MEGRRGIAFRDSGGCLKNDYMKHSFSQDVQKPEPPRLRRNLSAIINFCKFRDEKVYAFEELNQRLANLSHEVEGAEEQRAKNVSRLMGLARVTHETCSPCEMRGT